MGRSAVWSTRGRISEPGPHVPESQAERILTLLLYTPLRPVWQVEIRHPPEIIPKTAHFRASRKIYHHGHTPAIR